MAVLYSGFVYASERGMALPGATGRTRPVPLRLVGAPVEYDQWQPAFRIPEIRRRSQTGRALPWPCQVLK
jgi:hypothetical protein